MGKKTTVALGALNTILSTAPLIIQGAGKLIQIIRQRGATEHNVENIPTTVDGLKNEISAIHSRLDAHNASDLDQIKLIEELARQNQLLADTLRHAERKILTVTVIAALALGLGVILALVLLFT